MRVGFFTYGMQGETMTGIARYTVELTRALRTIAGIEVILLSPYPQAEHPWYKEFETYPVPSLKLLPMAATAGNAVLDRAAKKLNLDILHDPCGIAPFLLPKNGYKRVTTVHDAVPVLYPETQPLLTRLVFRTLVRASGRTADAVITVSQASATDLHEHLNIPLSKLYVTPLGVAPLEASHQARDKPYFLYVGALHPRKNLARVLEAFAMVRATSAVDLVIVGPPSWGAKEVVQTVLRQTGNAVYFTGFVSDNELATLYRGALALTFPSLYEGFGLPALEAMSHGTPVLTSNVSSLPEVVGDAALLVDPTSVEAIADAMKRLLNDEGLRTALGRKGRERAKSFTWQATADKTAELYRALLG